ncbi:hypothetical protein [Deinococcus actinosclerus]|uniref:GNAT family N-acetyltransferase n=1 Tax=Deinococcus actinosclerus TaxID=1768108 RepID=A0ABM5X336_9DEIO|nr:hypothetical protein [Deinococcus actinosclerus]ALW88086.1 hypothetical protein AUC44_03525 [Deinococcus actinosclerus]
MLPPVLADLLEFHAPLSTVQREQGGAVTLLTTGVNVLALNATFLPADLGGVDVSAVLDWHEGQGVPPLVATAGPLTALPGREVARVRVTRAGTAREGAGVGEGVVVEQVSRLHLGPWAEALTRAHGTPGWGAGLARQLAARLEGERAFVPLSAYRDGEVVGALLWQARVAGGGAAGGGAAHLWGAPDEEVEGALLAAAAGLGRPLQVSSVHETVTGGERELVHYSVLEL